MKKSKVYFTVLFGKTRTSYFVSNYYKGSLTSSEFRNLYYVNLNFSKRSYVTKGKKIEKLKEYKMMQEGVVSEEMVKERELAKKFLNKSPSFVTSASTAENLPPATLPEVCFIGRSNVGKSSLMNSIMSVSKLVKTSKTPGRTQTINYFIVGGGGDNSSKTPSSSSSSLPPQKSDHKSKTASEISNLYLVDCPGYGYAEAPLDIVDKWKEFNIYYLKYRGTIKLVCLLIDARRGIQQFDLEAIDLLEQNAIVYTIILTKGDAAKSTELNKALEQAKQICKNKTFCLTTQNSVFLTSSKANIGIDDLRALILKVCNIKPSRLIINKL